MNHRGRLTIAFVAAVAISLAACGGDSGDDSGDDGGDVPDGQITSDPETAFRLIDASADGAEIAFANGEGVGVLTVADGTFEMLIENTAARSYSTPTFLSDGRVAVVVNDDDEVGGTIGIVQDDGSAEPVPNSPNVTDIDGGPDGTIVFVEYLDAVRSLGSIDIDGSNLRTITDGPDDIDPAVSPDGSQVAFIRVEGGSSGTVSIVDRASGTIIGLIGSPQSGSVRSPEWAPDGARLAVSMTEEPDAEGLSSEQIFVLDPAVGTTQLTRGYGIKPQGVWISNDEVVYNISSNTDTDGQLFRIEVPTSD